MKMKNWKCDICGFETEVPENVDHVHHVCKSRGLGDTVAKVTKAFGIKPCGKCKKRQQALNSMVSYRKKEEK